MQRGMAFFEQFEFEGGEPGAKAVARCPQLFGSLGHGVVRIAICHQRAKHLYLPLCLEDSFVRPVEIFEMLDKGGNARLNREGLKHVETDEIGEVSHRLERDGLMKQLERLFIFDPETSPEPCAVGWKAFKQLNSRSTQPLAQG